MSAAKLQEWFPWTQRPVIANGPMLHAATPLLATEVTKAGGIGFIASAFDVSPDSANLKQLDSDLTQARELLGVSSGPINVGASFITGHKSITQFAETAIPVLQKTTPAIVWLFAPDGEVKPHSAVIQALKGLAHPPKVFVQVGNVTAAKEAIQDGADALICQGIDAGGHQFRRGMGVISFVPEVKKLLAESFADRQIPIFAAGGIVRGEGVAAAQALGADGIVMGTRFTVAKESLFPDFRKAMILNATDGGNATFKSPFNDQINKNALWGPLYDGRAIVTEIHQKFLDGASLEDCQTTLQTRQAETPEEAKRLIGTWAGTGVGLVNKESTASEIVHEVRDDAKAIIRKLAEGI
ncbi:hypothetical protein VHEMI00432 [[Torrubiella] hemipterigena]|uniref:Uncharacterized protein n=1 Tax=[Torrubiella] hemipterigena TaxID=1531966 RepID=A0A0A1SQF1_9HYPO|nr:hypothetical protein VHEMI00432 [[Torrubiella] hemipterigena]